MRREEFERMKRDIRASATLSLAGGLVVRPMFFVWEDLTAAQRTSLAATIVAEAERTLASLRDDQRLRLEFPELPPRLDAALRETDPRLEWAKVEAPKLVDDDDEAPIPARFRTPSPRPRCVVGLLDDLPLAKAWADFLEIDPRVRALLHYVYGREHEGAATALQTVPCHVAPELELATSHALLIGEAVFGDQIQHAYWPLFHAGLGEADVEFGFHDNLAPAEARELLARGFELVEARELVAAANAPRDSALVEAEIERSVRSGELVRRAVDTGDTSGVQPADLAMPIGMAPERWGALDRRLFELWLESSDETESIPFATHSVFDCHGAVMTAMGAHATFARALALALRNASHPSSSLWLLRTALERPAELTDQLRANGGAAALASLLEPLELCLHRLRGHAAVDALGGVVAAVPGAKKAVGPKLAVTLTRCAR